MANLVYDLTNNLNGELIIRNSLGQEIKRYNLSASKKTFEFSTYKLENAIYYYQVLEKGTEVANGKFSVIR